MPTSFTITILFDELDLERPEVLDKVFAVLPDAVTASVDGATTVSADIEAPEAVDAAEILVERVTQAVPTAVALRLDQDLVAIPDIADRTGRSRESIRLFVEGKRGPGSFPAPIGVVGDSIRVWPWASVLDWFRMQLGTDLKERAILPEEAAVVDALLAARRPTRSVLPTAAVSVSGARGAHQLAGGLTKIGGPTEAEEARKSKGALLREHDISGGLVRNPDATAPSRSRLPGTNADRIIRVLGQQGPLSDAQLVRVTGIMPHQQVNQICRRLEAQGLLRRVKNVGGPIVNVLVAPDSPS